MFNYLADIAKKIQGNILTIGVDNKILEGFLKNKKVNVYTLNRSNIMFSKHNKIKKDHRGKSINIKKLRRYFKKKSIDYLFINFEEIEDYLKYVVKDIIYINSNKLYLYCSKESDIPLIEKRFKRYNISISKKSYKEIILLEINNQKSKNNWAKDKIYYLLDTIYNLVELISNILIN